MIMIGRHTQNALGVLREPVQTGYQAMKLGNNMVAAI